MSNENYEARIAKLEKALSDNIGATVNYPDSMQVEYSDVIKSKVGEVAPYYRFLETKGCVQSTPDPIVGFYVEQYNNTADFIEELGDLPEHKAGKYTEQLRRMSTIATGIEVSYMSEMGNNVIDYLKRQIQNGYIDITNKLDKTLLSGSGDQTKSTPDLDFPGFSTAVTTNVVDNSGNKITENIINNLIDTVTDTYKGRPDCIVTNYTVVRQLRDIIKDYYRFNDKVDVGIGFRVNTFEAENGQQLPILVDPNLADNSLFLVDSSTIEIKQMMAPTLFTDLPTSKLTYKQAIATFITAQNIAEFQNGIIKNIGTTTPSG